MIGGRRGRGRGVGGGVGVLRVGSRQVDNPALAGIALFAEEKNVGPADHDPAALPHLK